MATIVHPLLICLAFPPHIAFAASRGSPTFPATKGISCNWDQSTGLEAPPPRPPPILSEPQTAVSSSARHLINYDVSNADFWIFKLQEKNKAFRPLDIRYVWTVGLATNGKYNLEPLGRWSFTLLGGPEPCKLRRCIHRPLRNWTNEKGIHSSRRMPILDSSGRVHFIYP